VSAKFPITSGKTFRLAIAANFEGLSGQLKKIARYIDASGEQIGFQGVREVAVKCDVQPSAIVRFAKHFGLSGFSEMQAVFRDDIARKMASPRNYSSRIRDVIKAGDRRLTSAEIAHEFIGGSVVAMQALAQQLDEAAFEGAVIALAESDSIWVVAARRSFPIAAYLDYALQHTDKRVQMLSGLGAMHQGQARSVRAGDVMLAISFAPYAKETLACVGAAHERGAKIIAITDSDLSPLARQAAHVLVVKDDAAFGFRALTSTMGLSQSLFIALAYRLALPPQVHPT
jgi:DNA-binding MurR/RpiR family transcriptional regulator